MEDGTIKEGYLKDFNDENFVSFYPQKIAESFGAMEENNGLSNEFYYFKSDENSEEEKLSFNNITRIEFSKESTDSDDYKFAYEKVKIASIDNELQMVFKDKDVLLPIYYSNSKIKVYSLLVSFASTTFPYFYIKTPENEYAVRVFKISMGDGFNLKKVGQKYMNYYITLEIIVKDLKISWKRIRIFITMNLLIMLKYNLIIKFFKKNMTCTKKT